MKSNYAQAGKTLIGNAVFWIVVAGLIVFFIGRISGRRKGRSEGHVIAPVDPENLSFDPVVYAQKIYAAFNPWNLPGPWPGERGSILEEMANFTDNELRAVYNAYNEKYKQAPETLLTDLKSEIIFNSPRDFVVGRMEALGLA